MRVIAGKFRSIPLITPSGDNTRPTQDRIKETLFNMIQSDLPGCVFFDLFSGSGGIGIEALSRGARRSYLVERDSEALKCIRENVKKCRCESDCEIAVGEVLSFLASYRGPKPDIIFMDPPYLKDWERKVLTALKEHSLLKEDTLIIVEADLNTSFDYVEEAGYRILKIKKYKTNEHVFLTPFME